MLVDEVTTTIARYRQTPVEPGRALVLQALAKAHKFAFDAPTIEAAIQLWPHTLPKEEVQKRLPFCRLPFPTCWFEFPYEGTKFGFLLHSDSDLQTFQGFCVVEDRDTPGLLGSYTYRISEGEVTSHGNGEDTEDIHRAFGDILTRLLFILNIKNLVTREFVDKTSHNQKRVRKGRPPLFSYHVCRIRQSTRLPAAADQTGESGGVRAHLVRGHLKARKTRVFVWSPHARGDAGFGVVHKEYRV
jgi:hypothetical protein